MSVDVHCPSCSKAYSVAEDQLGKAAKCRQCGQRFSLATTSPHAPAQETNANRQAPTRTSPPTKIDRFEIRAKLGAGAFGAVYRAFDPLLEREVALKVPHPGLFSSQHDKARYLREPKAAAQLRHPNIVPIFDAGVDDENFYVASAFIPGRTLERSIEEGIGDFRQAASLVMKLANALDYAHSQKIVHRDVKPANIMLDEQGEPHLMDFGLARIREAEDKLTHDGTVLGTPAYMPPEQASGQLDKVGPASDQYSLGVVLYELLCGERPFSGPPALVISLVINSEPPSPRTHNPQIPLDLETICLKAMAKDATARYGSCAALAEDLRRWAADEPIQARPMSAWERSRKWCRRNPALAIASVALAASLLIGGTLSLAFGIQANASAEEATTALKLQQEETKRAEREKELADKAKNEADTERNKSDQARREAEAARDTANRERELSRRNLYVAHMNLAQAAWENSHADQTMRLLELQRPAPGNDSAARDLRSFEWYYWQRLCYGTPTLKGHSNNVTSVTYSKDVKWLGSGSTDSTIKIWDMRTGKERLSIKTGKQVSCIAFSPDAKRIAGSNSKVITIWDTTTGQKILSLTGHAGEVTGVAFSPDGKRIVSGSYSKRLPGNRREEGKSDHTIKIWDAITGLELLDLKGHVYEVYCVAFSPDGVSVASGGNDGTFRIWDARTGQETLSRKSDKQVHCIAFSPDGMRIAVGDFESISICDANTLSS